MGREHVIPDKVEGHHRTVSRDQLVTIGDLEGFGRRLLADLTALISAKGEGAQNRWFRSSHVRKMLGISAGSLQHLRVSGKLPYSRIGSIVYYKEEDVQKMLESNYRPGNGDGAVR